MKLSKINESCTSYKELQQKDEALAAFRKYRKKLLAKRFNIVPDDPKRANPKHNKTARRPRGKLGKFTPYAIRRPIFLKHPVTGKKTVFFGYKGFESNCIEQFRINIGLAERAQFCAMNGYYLQPWIPEPEATT